jgi:hypothetical protein
MSMVPLMGMLIADLYVEFLVALTNKNFNKFLETLRAQKASLLQKTSQTWEMSKKVR